MIEGTTSLPQSPFLQAICIRVADDTFYVLSDPRASVNEKQNHLKDALLDAKKTNDIVLPPKGTITFAMYPCLPFSTTLCGPAQVCTRPRTAPGTTNMTDVDAGSPHLASNLRYRHDLYTRNGDGFISFPTRSGESLWQLIILIPRQSTELQSCPSTFKTTAWSARSTKVSPCFSRRI